MELIILASIFILGLLIGSFLACTIYRLEKEESSLKGRSYCPHCKHDLLWLDLVPLLSYLFLRGKCRYCHKKISSQYFFIEIATGLLFLFIALHAQSNIFYLGFLLILWSLLMIIFVYDIKHYLIPESILFLAIGITFLYQLFFNSGFLFFNAFFSSLGAAFFFWLLYYVSGETWMGFGDVELAILLGLLLGFPSVLVALFLAFLLGAIVGVCSMAFGKKGIKSQLPFAPFLIIGTFLTLFYGSFLLDWYLQYVIF